MSHTLTNVLEEFIAANQDLENNTKNSYRYAWTKLIRAIGNKYIFEVNSNDIEDFRSWLFGQKYEIATVESSMKNASPVMAWSIRRGYRRGNPFEGVRRPVVPEKQIRVYSDAELSAMFRCANLLWQTKIITAASAGLRLGEIQNLRWQDVNFDEGFINVQGRESTRDFWKWYPKNKKNRQVPLSEQLERLFTMLYERLPEKQPYIMLTERRYYNLQKKRQFGNELEPKLCKKPDDSNRRWYTILRRSRIWDGCFHDLRSTAITNWLLSGTPPQEVQKLAGHAHIETTMKYYAACRKDYIQRAKLEIGATGLEPATS